MELFYFPLFLFVLFCCFFFTKKSLKTPSEAVNRKRTDNAKTKNRTDNYLHTKNRDWATLTPLITTSELMCSGRVGSSSSASSMNAPTMLALVIIFRFKVYYRFPVMSSMCLVYYLIFEWWMRQSTLSNGINIIHMTTYVSKINKRWRIPKEQSKMDNPEKPWQHSVHKMKRNKTKTQHNMY
jgi:hypothetical protein